MTKFLTYITLFFLTGFLSACSEVLQTVYLNINSENSSLQEEFNVVEKTLTIREAKAQKTTQYFRQVLKYCSLNKSLYQGLLPVFPLEKTYFYSFMFARNKKHKAK